MDRRHKNQMRVVAGGQQFRLLSETKRQPSDFLFPVPNDEFQRISVSRMRNVYQFFWADLPGKFRHIVNDALIGSKQPSSEDPETHLHDSLPL